MVKIRTFSSNQQLVEKRRQQIIHCARHLFVKKGFERTTMRDIGRACRMTSAGIYHYVGKKDDILNMVVQNQYASIYAFIRATEEDTVTIRPVESLTRAVSRYYRLLDENRDDVAFVSNNYMLFKPALRLQVVETLANVIAVFERILIKARAAENAWLLAFNIVGLGQLWVLRQGGLAHKCGIDQYIEFQTGQILGQLGGGEKPARNRRETG